MNYARLKDARLLEKHVEQNKALLIGGVAIAMGGLVCAALWRKIRPSGSAFVVEAYAKGLAEIAVAELALQKSTSVNVREFAQCMIEDHTNINKELETLARRLGLQLEHDTRVLDKAYSFLLKRKEGKTFDEAYAEHQLKAHKQTLALFYKAMKCKDATVRYFAAVSLYKLKSHLKMSEKLVKSVHRADSDEDLPRHASRDVANGSLPKAEPVPTYY